MQRARPLGIFLAASLLGGTLGARENVDPVEYNVTHEIRRLSVF